MSVPAKSFDGTAITSSMVFIAGRSLAFKALYASDHEVTQGEYEAYCKYGGDSPNVSLGKGANYPAYNVNWYDAIVYCNLRSRADGLDSVYKIGSETDPTKWEGIEGNATDKWCGPYSTNSKWDYTGDSDADGGIQADFGKNGWRLPTEAEWEMLARGGNLANSNQTTYSGSDTIDSVAWYQTNSDGKTHEVKGKTKNGLDLYDMSGNVWEWCWDWHGSINASTPASGASSGSVRVCRGGGWGRGASECSVAPRSRLSPYDRGDLVGFRVVRNAN